MKRSTLIVIMAVLFSLLALFFVVSSIMNLNIPDYNTKVDSDSFYILKNGAWEKQFIKGVNMGVAKPGTFPGQLAITKQEYLRWFKYIGDMNANVIRVYTTQNPDFYNALYEHNQTAKQPLYLIQGVWINEDEILSIGDAFGDNGKIKKDFIKDALNLVDVIHGEINLPKQPGFASGKYNKDVSRYVLGWILGVEWDPIFVKTTNEKNPDKDSYEGNYLYTENASPFEAFLCEVGDEIVNYETEKYKTQHTLSFNNWLTTDPLKHPNEPWPKEDLVEVNVEHIKAKRSFRPGQFASYHIYPYYPEFMNYQKEYRSFKDKNGKVNTYKAYLRDLKRKHTMPILVAEYGVPSSRGMAHRNIRTGFNQGNHDERSQGMIDTKLLKDIFEEGYAGAVIFTWHDEWFKRTWNTMDLDMPDRRPFWSNVQTCEQKFGLLTFDPGKAERICYVDGDIDEWNDDSLIGAGNNVKLFTKSDEEYVYIMVKTSDFNFNKDKLLIPIDTVDGQGNGSYKPLNVTFDRPADFLIEINGKHKSRIYVDSYYDSFYFLYSKKLNMVDANPEYEKPGNGIFNPVYLCLNRELYLPEDKKTTPFSQYETGILTYGNANPKDPDYNSLADFYYKYGAVEIRIPWQLLNVMDPSTKMVMGDLYADNSIKPVKVKIFFFGAGLSSEERESVHVEMHPYSWEEWETPIYHERLKPSYYIIKDAFKKYGGRE